MIIKTAISNDWRVLSDCIYYGQVGNYVICETSETPIFDYEELGEDFSDFTQFCVKTGLVDNQPTIAELRSTLERLTPLGERGLSATDLFSLEVLEELKQKEDEINALALTILDLLEV